MLKNDIMTISGTITMYIIIIKIRIGIYHGFFSENFSSIGSRCEFHLLYIKLRTGTIFDIYYVIIYIIIHLYINSGIKTQVKINRDVDNYVQVRLLATTTCFDVYMRQTFPIHLDAHADD